MSWPFERVVLVRHGETEWNRAGRRQGQLDSPLTDAGERHAERIAVWIASSSVDAIFSSPLGRAHQTAVAIGARTGLPVQVLQDLAEVHHGSFAGLTNNEIEAAHPGVLRQREGQKYRWSFPGGESYADADDRASRALRDVGLLCPKTPLLVTHEMIGRMLLRTLLGVSPQEALAWSLPHGTVIEVAPRDRLVSTIVVTPRVTPAPPP